MIFCRTMCGTPNYIAPEVLDRSGHGVEVDNWAVGVILYALLVGTPPFETKAVETTYDKIRRNEFAFPFDNPISTDAQDLITKILVPNPTNRLSIAAIRGHRFFSVSLRPALHQVLSVPLAASSQKANLPSIHDIKSGQREADLFGDDAAPYQRGAKPTLDQDSEAEANYRKRKRGSDTEDMQAPEKRQATAANVAAVQQANSTSCRTSRFLFFSCGSLL
jgi:serine/threonine protein kinase